MISGSARPGSFPDESAHLSYIAHMAKSPSRLIPDYDNLPNLLSETRNHLIHPPAYYYLAGRVYEWTDRGEEEGHVARNQEGRATSAVYKDIRVLRGLSLTFFLIGLASYGLIALRLVWDQLLSPVMASVFIALVGFLPSRTFIGGAVNNDVLGFALFPVALLAGLEFIRTGSRISGLCSSFASALLILTKAIFWIPALLPLTLIALGLWRVKLYFPGRAKLSALCSCAILVLPFLAASVYPAVMAAEYGEVQPHYTDVIGRDVSESKFFSARGSAQSKGVLGISEEALTKLSRSTTGIHGHDDREYRSDHKLIGVIFSVTGLTALALGFWQAIRGKSAYQTWRGRLATGLMGTFVLWICVFLFRSVSTFEKLGNFGAQGRYTLGSLEAALLGICLIASGARWLPREGALIWAFGSVLVVALVIRPWLFWS
jgi:hypothetical protein